MGKRETGLRIFETPLFLCYHTGIAKGGTAMCRETVTAAEMKALERAANENGLLYIQMMENAGHCGEVVVADIGIAAYVGE